MQDKLEKERNDAKNYVEEYVYEMRDKLHGVLENFVSEAVSVCMCLFIHKDTYATYKWCFLLIKQCFSIQERDSFSLKLEDTENWLYEEGEDQQKQVYIDKLAELKVKVHVDLFKFEPVWKNEWINKNSFLLETGRAYSKPIHWERGAAKSVGRAGKANPAVHENCTGL